MPPSATRRRAARTKPIPGAPTPIKSRASNPTPDSEDQRTPGGVPSEPTPTTTIKKPRTLRLGSKDSAASPTFTEENAPSVATSGSSRKRKRNAGAPGEAAQEQQYPPSPIPLQLGADLPRMVTVLPDLPPNYLLNKYTVVSVLGHGNFATTYLARTPSGQEYAIKRYHPAYNSIGESEILYLTSFTNSKIVKLHDHFYFSDCLHLVLTALSPRPLALPKCPHQIQQQRPAHSVLACPVRHKALLKIITQLLSALLPFHNKSLIHADVTASNILFVSAAPSSTAINLIDLGNVIAPADRPAYTSDYDTQSVCYRAPEVTLGVTGSITPKIDVWSVGVIALELLLDGQCVGDGVEGAELLHPPGDQRRESHVRRVVELFGSVVSGRDGMYWIDVYDTVSRRWKKDPMTGEVVSAGEKRGLMEEFVWEKIGDDGLKRWIEGMVKVDPEERKSVRELLKDRWVLAKMLGDEWAAAFADEDEGGRDESDLVDEHTEARTHEEEHHVDVDEAGEEEEEEDDSVNLV